MRKHTSLVAACGILLLAAGCGGGGGGSSVHRLTDTLRSYQVGDEWVYNVNGTWKGAFGSGVEMFGTVTRSMSIMTMGGSNYLGVTVLQELRPRSAYYEQRRETLLRQNATTRDVCALGDSLNHDSWRMVINTTKPITVPGAWSVGYGRNDTTDYETGGHSYYSFNVQGTETVITPVGTFETYRVAVTEDDLKYYNSTATRTEWWHPGLGAPVKYTEHCVIPGGATLDYTATLRGTNVAVP